MCHSFTICSYQDLERAIREIAQGDAAPIPEGIRTGGVAFPGMLAPVFVAQREGGSLRDEDSLFTLEVDEMGFGWPVEWKQGTVFNARFESLIGMGSHWGDALMTRRCILPCESFFESSLTETVSSPKTGRPMKRRYAFRDIEGRPLLLGAVYEGDFFSVVTTEPNGDVAPVHDRMPLVLTPEEARLWLDPDTSLEAILPLADRGSIRLASETEGKPRGTAEQLGLGI